MASQFQTIPQLHTSFSNSSRSPDDDSSSDTPGGSRASSRRYSYSNGSMKRESVDYTSMTDVDVGYTSAASNSTFIPSYTLHHSQRFVSPTMYEQSPSNPISPQAMVPTGSGNVQPPEQYASPGGVVTSNGGNAGSVAQNSSAAAQYRRAPPATPPVPLACTECRLRHLKCDAGVPTCGRCRAEGRSCCYVKSRRGWKGRKRKGSTATSAGGMTSGTEASETGKGESGGEGDYVGKSEFFVCTPQQYPRIYPPSSFLSLGLSLFSSHRSFRRFLGAHYGFIIIFFTVHFILCFVFFSLACDSLFSCHVCFFQFDLDMRDRIRDGDLCGFGGLFGYPAKELLLPLDIDRSIACLGPVQ